MGIGRITKLYIDESRKEIIGDVEHHLRKVPISIFYPTDFETVGKYKDLYEPKDHLLAKIYSNENSKKIDFLYDLPLNVKNNVEIKAGKYPVVIFSHGLTADRDFFTFLYEPLVNNGYIVVTVGHLYDTDLTLLPDGTEVLMKKDIDKDVSLKERNEQLVVRKEDVCFIYNKLGEINDLEELKNSLDLENVFIGGHSLGAITTLYSSLEIKNLKGAFTFDLPVHLINIKILNEHMEARKLPFLNIYRYFKNPDSLKLMNNIIASKFNTEKENFIMIKDTDHMVFSDWYTLNPELYKYDDEQLKDTLNLISQIVLNFLNDILNHTTTYHEMLEKNQTKRIIVKQ